MCALAWTKAHLGKSRSDRRVEIHLLPLFGVVNSVQRGVNFSLEVSDFKRQTVLLMNSHT